MSLEPPVVVIDYTNYRGERAERRVLPYEFVFETGNKFHGDAWIMRAVDIEKAVTRDFAMASIHSWREEPRR